MVADGVGGWMSSHNVDSGFFSRHLVSGIHEKFEKTPGSTPKNLLMR